VNYFPLLGYIFSYSVNSFVRGENLTVMAQISSGVGFLPWSVLVCNLLEISAGLIPIFRIVFGW
jgi:hypothetical protein